MILQLRKVHLYVRRSVKPAVEAQNEKMKAFKRRVSAWPESSHRLHIEDHTDDELIGVGSKDSRPGGKQKIPCDS